MIDTLQQLPLSFFHAGSAVLGLFIGSFLNVVILRLPVMMKFAWQQDCREFLELTNGVKPAAPPAGLLTPGSRCPQCGHRITPGENIPVLGFILLRGRCAGCDNRISFRYPFIEILTALLTLAVAVQFGVTVQTLFACLFTWALISLAFIDIDQQLLPDNITLPLLWTGLLCNYFGLFTDLHSGVMGAVLGYGIFWCVYQSFKLITRREGMGLGDLKLLAMLGAWTGWQFLAAIILVSSLLGSLAGLCLIFFRRRRRTTPISFGPYLALAGWLSLVWGLNLDLVYGL